MKILLSWLKEYVDISETPEKIANALLMAGIEVEAIHQPGAGLKDVVVGKILTCEKHPNADKLSLCTVDIGKTAPLAIVCGATNMTTGDLVPIALVGAKLPSGMEIRKANIRGVESSGMMCSRKELGISEDHGGLFILPKETGIGENIVDVLGLNDVVFEISVTPNRGDVLSHLGIARELSAIFNLPLSRNALDNSDGDGNIAVVTSVTNEAPDLCPRYGARVVEGVKVGDSPKWLKDRLEKIGVRSINNVVDITNYVMMDIGHPMHAFDLDKLYEDRIIVRKAKPEERFKTLDKVERILDPGMLVIADARGPVALAGVMGGLDSEVTTQTVRLLLEAAYFDPTCIRKTAKAFGMMSESSYRFERGTNVENIPIALNLAVKYCRELADGRPLKGIVDSYPHPQPLKRIHARVRRISQVIGVEFKPHMIETLLLRLKFEVSREGEDLWIGVPPYRHDIEQEADIIEEVARLYGYDHIPNSLPTISSTANPPTPIHTLERRVRDHLLSTGFSQIISYSFISGATHETLQEGIPLKLKNPLSEEQSIMRSSLLPGMIDALKRNMLVDEFDLRFFEVGRVFQRKSGDQTVELNRLSLGMTGRANPNNWRRNSEKFDLFYLKGFITSIGKLWGQNPEFRAGTREALHPSQQLEVRCCGHFLGHFGMIHPRYLDNKKFPQEIFLAEIDLGLLADQPRTHVRVQPIPEIPAIRRDLALVVPMESPHEELISCIRKEGGKLLENCSLFDVYQGKGVEAGKKSMAFSLTFRGHERTLTDEEVQPIVDSMIAQAGRQFKAKLREG